MRRVGGRCLISLVSMFLAVGAYAVDLVRVEKSERKMHLIAGDEIVKTYDIALGDNPLGHKQQEGDERTPEGAYVLDWRNPQSRYHLSIHISYPNKDDRARARRDNVAPGGDIFIHGLPNGTGLLGAALEGRDWTDGCIAVNDNDAMQEIWDLVPNGTKIIINP